MKKDNIPVTNLDLWITLDQVGIQTYLQAALAYSRAMGRRKTCTYKEALHWVGLSDLIGRALAQACHHKL